MKTSQKLIFLSSSIGRLQLTFPAFISVGRKPEAIQHRPWALHSGNTGIRWLEPDHPKNIALQSQPVVGRTYQLRLLGNFQGTIGSEQLFIWLPPNASYNGFDDTNVEELEQVRFYLGKLIGYDLETGCLSYKPERFLTPFDLAKEQTTTAPLTDTLFTRKSVSLKHGRLRWIEFDLEGDVASAYLLVDSNLVMLDLMVGHNHHFWIGHASVAHKALQFNDSAE